jgi:hypothetical protein
MTYLVFHKKTGDIIRRYRKIRDGRLVPAVPADILSHLANGVAVDDVDFVDIGDLKLERGKQFKIDVRSKKVSLVPIGSRGRKSQPRQGSRKS